MAVLSLAPGLLLAACGRHAAVDLHVPIVVTRVTDRVIVLDCLSVNVTALAARDGILIVDTGRSPSLMQEIVARIEREFGRRDVTHVINTHGHHDHTGGNPIFPDAIRIGHANCPAFMRNGSAGSPGDRWSLEDRLERDKRRLASRERSPAEAESLRGEIRARALMLADLRRNYAITPPNRTFTDRLTIDLGDLTAELIYAGETHTNNDIVVYVPQERLLVTGDLFCSPNSLCFSPGPFVDVARLASVLDELLGREPGVEVAIPGHGAVLTRPDLERLRQLVADRCATFDGGRSAAARLGAMIEAHGAGEALERWERSEVPGRREITEQEFTRLAERLLWRGKVDEAIQVLEYAASVLPESALIHGSLGETRLKRGDVRSAMASLERSLELVPENRRAAGILRMLREED
jgi:glyoxylase-like metal-dependent hydrolase (beta-lactamase superfamily II)